MTDIMLNKVSLNSIRSQLSKMQSEAEASRIKISSVINGLDFEVAARENIKSHLNSINKVLSKQEILAERYGKVFINVSNQMVETDGRFGNSSKSIFDKIKDFFEDNTNRYKDFSIRNKLLKFATVIELFLKGESIATKTKNWIMDTIKKAGHFGALVALADGLVNGIKNNDKIKIGKTLYSGWKAIKNVAKDVKNLGKVKRILHPDTIKQSWKKRILGITDYFTRDYTASKWSNWWGRFRQNLRKAGRKEVAKVTWASAAVSGIFNAFDNKKEYDKGEISAGRAVVETITETAVDVAVDIGVTSVVAAAVGATAVGLGATVAAPGVLVAAGTVAVKSFVLDPIAKWATGGEKDFTEFVSDGLIDTATKIGQGLSSAVKKLGNCISGATKSFKPRWKLGFGL